MNRKLICDVVMTMNIGQLAGELGLDRQTIRYYERIGLLDPAARTPANYRVYREEDIKKLRFIQRVKNLGLSLQEIKTLISLAEGTAVNCAEVRSFIDDRLEAVRVQIRHLQVIENTFEDLAQQCRDKTRLSGCPVIETLTAEDD